MGLDGGTIPTRSDILRGQSWRLANNDAGAQRSTRGGQLTATGALATAGLEHRDRRQDAADGWAMCALAGTPLVNKPGSVVACELGHLYMRDSVIEFLPAIQPGMEQQAFMSELEAVVEAGSHRLLVEAGFEGAT